MDWGQRYGAKTIVENILNSMDEEARLSSVMDTDVDGNSSIHLAAYYGQDDVIPVLLKQFPSIGIDEQNNLGETPVTIAIKRRGYHRTVEVLQAFGASIPEDRVEGLIRFCLQQDFARTAGFLKKRLEDGELVPSLAGEDMLSWDPVSDKDLPALEFDEDVPHRAVKSRLDAALAKGRPIDYRSVALAGLRFVDVELVKMGVARLDAKEVDPSFLFQYCFPNKADAPDTNIFLEMLQTILDFSLDLLGAVQPVSGDTLLHRAISAGSLPHTQFLISQGLPSDGQNTSGNTPLHIACIKRYPCIVDFLLTTGADVNVPNNRGATPIAVAIQMGSQRIVENLIAAGAMTDGPAVITSQGENLLHIAVRNNQYDILSLLLDRADPETMLEIDENGLNPIFAAVEGDRRECLNLLLETASDYFNRGIPGFEENVLKMKMTTDSNILPGATALHAAVFFDRRLALSVLLERGANTDAPDNNGMTPLHYAAQRGDASAVYTLVSSGASPSTLDHYGRNPASYGMSHPDVVAALVGPIPGPLLCFCSGEVSDTRSASACEDVVRRAPIVAAEPGLFSATQVLDTPLDDTGQTALIIAASHGNVGAVRALLDGGCSPEKEDKQGLSAAVWAQMRRSQRLIGALGLPARPRLPAAERHALVGQRWGTADAMSVFLGGKRDMSWPLQPASSSLYQRLVLLAEAFSQGGTSRNEYAKEVKSVDLLKASPRSGSVERVMIASPGTPEQHALDADRWSCKIDTARAVAAGSSMRPSHIFAAFLSTRHGPLVPCLNNFLARAPASSVTVSPIDRPIQNFSVALFDLLGELPPCNDDEMYAVAPPGISRASLAVGSAITLHSFVSATSDWSIALSALDKVHGINDSIGRAINEENGIVLIIKKCHSGRAIGQRSTFQEDREVMFSPGTAFRVRNWYCGSVKALGQHRVREEAILAPEKLNMHDCGGGSLLIEVEEFCSL
mmetsp:Transcript_63429/g.94119  ORF Transcript_63429/g.94119 Transcript_63429/m.94119 type:complete len:964 (+) Transcript_63429:2037-4928(+)